MLSFTQVCGLAEQDLDSLMAPLGNSFATWAGGFTFVGHQLCSGI